MKISILKMLGYGDIYSNVLTAPTISVINSQIQFSIIDVRFLCLNN